MALLRQNRTLWIAFYAFLALALLAGVYLAVLSATGAPKPVADDSPDPEGQAVVLEGTYVCLPRTDNSKSTECTPGIKVSEDYYALDLAVLLGAGTVTNFSNGTKILAGGEIIALEDVQSDQWDIYPVKGVMRVVEVARN